MSKQFLKKVAKIFLLGILITTGYLRGAEAAKEKPTFIWSRDEIFQMSVTGSDQVADKKRAYSLLNTGTKEQQEANKKIIADALADKLKEQESILPFKLKTVMASTDTEKLNADFETEKPIQIVPIVVTDFVIPQVYTIKGKEYYKYILISALDIAFCSEDEDGAYTILSNIPLHFRKDIPSTADLSVMTERSRDELARLYASFTAQMIRENLDFKKYKKLVDRVADNSLGVGETYRVENVIYTSKKMQELLGMNRLMQRISGNIFTSDFAAYTGAVVYPMILPGDTTSWVKDAQKGLYSLQITSTLSGQKTVTMPQHVDHKITLDVVGLGTQEVQTAQTSELFGFKVYKLRLMSTISGKNSIEVSNDMSLRYTKDRSAISSIEPSEPEIFGSLLIGASVDAAKAQAGKKIK